MKKVCQQCGVEMKGRIDKRFCSDYCRNAFHNERNRGLNSYIREVNSTLKKNRSILASLNPHGKNKIHKNDLQSQGFNFKYFTSVYRTKAGKVYYFCYDQGYLPLDNDFFALVVKQEYAG